MKKSRERNLNRWDLLFALLFISFLTYLFKTAVNGESVYLAKGWSTNSINRS